MAGYNSNLNISTVKNKNNQIKQSTIVNNINFKNNVNDKSFNPHLVPLSFHRLYRLNKFVTTITNTIHRKKFHNSKKSNQKLTNQSKLNVMEQFSIKTAATTTTISLAILFIIVLQHANMIMQRTLAHPVSMEENQYQQHPKSSSSNKIDQEDILKQNSNQLETTIVSKNNKQIHSPTQHSWIERNKRSGIADQRLAELLELARMDMIRKLVRDNSRAIGEGIAYGLIDPAVIGRRRRRRRDVRSVMDSTQQQQKRQQQQQEHEQENDENLDRLVANLLWQQVRKQRLLTKRNNKSMAIIKDGQRQQHPQPSSRNTNQIAERQHTNQLISPFSWLWYSMINEKKQNVDQSKSAKTLQKLLEQIYQD